MPSAETLSGEAAAPEPCRPRLPLPQPQPSRTLAPRRPRALPPAPLDPPTSPLPLHPGPSSLRPPGGLCLLLSSEDREACLGRPSWAPSRPGPAQAAQLLCLSLGSAPAALGDLRLQRPTAQDSHHEEEGALSPLPLPMPQSVPAQTPAGGRPCSGPPTGDRVRPSTRGQGAVRVPVNACKVHSVAGPGTCSRSGRCHSVRDDDHPGPGAAPAAPSALCPSAARRVVGASVLQTGVVQHSGCDVTRPWGLPVSCGTCCSGSPALTECHLMHRTPVPSLWAPCLYLPAGSAPRGCGESPRWGCRGQPRSAASPGSGGAGCPCPRGGPTKTDPCRARAPGHWERAEVLRPRAQHCSRRRVLPARSSWQSPRLARLAPGPAQPGLRGLLKILHFKCFFVKEINTVLIYEIPY